MRAAETQERHSLAAAPEVPCRAAVHPCPGARLSAPVVPPARTAPGWRCGRPRPRCCSTAGVVREGGGPHISPQRSQHQLQRLWRFKIQQPPLLLLAASPLPPAPPHLAAVRDAQRAVHKRLHLGAAAGGDARDVAHRQLTPHHDARHAALRVAQACAKGAGRDRQRQYKHAQQMPVLVARGRQASRHTPPSCMHLAAA